MPGRLFITQSALGLARGFDAEASAEIAPLAGDDVAPGDLLPVLCPDHRVRPVRWGMIPSGRVNARGRPVLETIVNARSETVFTKSAFAGVGRAVVFADGWFEWTGKARRKQRWRLSRADGAPMAIAAIHDLWSGPGGLEVAQVATLTTEPNAEVAEIHHRMGVFLAPEDVPDWIAGVAEVPGPLPDGAIRIEAV